MPILTKPDVNTIWAERGDSIAPSTLKIARGWVVEIPPHQQMNWWMKRADSFISHVNQRGIPAWDATTQYYNNLSYVVGVGNGLLYRAVQDSMGQNPETTTGYWQEAFMSRISAYTKAEIDAFRATDRGYVDSTFLKISSNLADVADKAAARQNLQVYSTAQTDGRYMQISKSLSDVPDVASARTTLQVYSKSESDNKYADRAKNLSDLLDKVAARANLGLGNSAILNVGVSSGTVAAGDDSRIVNATPKQRRINVGPGLSGGGSLENDVSLSLGRPGTISAASQNIVQGDTHYHALDVSGLFPAQYGENGYCRLPNGLWMIWGVSGDIPVAFEGVFNVPFHIAFPSACLNVQVSLQNDYAWGGQSEKVIGLFGGPLRDMVRVNIGYIRDAGSVSKVRYFAVGY